MRSQTSDVSQYSQEKKKSADDVKQLEIKLLPLKSMILGTTAVISTLLSLFIAAGSGNPLIMNFDQLVNQWLFLCALIILFFRCCKVWCPHILPSCLLLMTRYWSRTYWRVCTPLLNCFARSEACFDQEHRDGLSYLIAHYEGKHDPELERVTSLTGGKDKPTDLDASSLQGSAVVGSQNSQVASSVGSGTQTMTGSSSNETRTTQNMTTMSTDIETAIQ